VVYAVLSLTLVRMLPVGLSLLGTGVSPPTDAYVGWFGPRGLASIVFASLVIDAQLLGASTIITTIVLTVTVSILLHGATANVDAERYGAWFSRASDRDPSIPENADVSHVHVVRRKRPTV
jgi:NhaP-type Na+/H+ or K+/H+ antiporter